MSPRRVLFVVPCLSLAGLSFACSAPPPPLRLDRSGDASHPDIQDVRVSRPTSESSLPFDSSPHNTPKTISLITAGGEKNDVMYACAMCASGMLFLAGTFQDRAWFGNDTITSNGGFDAFVAMLSPSRQFSWTRSFGSTGDESGPVLAIHPNGGVVVTGSIAGEVAFGAKSVHTAGGILAGRPSSLYVTRIDNVGDFVWTTVPDMPTTSRGYGIAVDSRSDIRVVGSFKETLTWQSRDAVSVGNEDMFAARLNEDALAWLVSGGGSENDVARAVGVYAGKAHVLMQSDSSEIALSPQLHSLMQPAVLRVSLDAKGAATGFVDLIHGNVSPITMPSFDSRANIYVAGTFTGMAKFQTSKISSHGGSDVFVAAVNENGGLSWVAAAGSTANDCGIAATVDAQGQVFVTGSFKGTAQFGTTTIHSTAQSSDVFVASYSSAGALRWIVTAGGDDLDSGSCIFVDASGRVDVAGTFSGTADFGGNKRIARGQNDVFVWTFAPPP